MILTSAESRCWIDGSGESRATLVERWREGLPPEDSRKRVEALLGDLSQELWAAGWLGDIDRRAWQLVHCPRPRFGLTPGDCLDHSITEVVSWVAELAALTIYQGWFPCYDLPPDARNARMLNLSDYSRGL